MTAKTVTVAGLDPGPKPGTCVLSITPWPEPSKLIPLVIVTTGVSLDQLLEADYVAIERYVVQPRSGRSQDKGAQVATMVMAEEMHTKAIHAGLAPQYLGPGNVKPWATNARLDKYGLRAPGAGVHHRDAIRHALFMAVKRGLLPRL